MDGKIIIEFRQGCPITGKIEFEAMWNCSEENEKKVSCRENEDKVEQNLLEFNDGKGKLEIKSKNGVYVMPL